MLAKIKCAIEEMIEAFRENPFEFLYESDVRACLSCILHKKFSSEDDQISMKTTESGPKFLFGKFVSFSPVKTEYPSKKSKLSLFKKNFDIVVIDRWKIDDNTHLIKLAEKKNEFFWNRKIKAAIEIKLCQLGDTFLDKFNEMGKDTCKFREYRDTILKNESLIGLALLFVQPRKEDIKKMLSGYHWKLRKSLDFLKEGITSLVITESELLEVLDKP